MEKAKAKKQKKGQELSQNQEMLLRRNYAKQHDGVRALAPLVSKLHQQETSSKISIIPPLMHNMSGNYLYNQL